MMEQYLIRVPKKVGAELRKKMQEKEVRGVDVVAGADNKHFKFHIDDSELPSTLCQLPCILETHKTYDDNLFYKSGEIGQILLVHESAEEQMLYETVTELPSGITPPTTNIVKRKYAKTRKYPAFPKPDVARVEDTLVKIIAGGVIEDVQEELVDFYDWMIDDQHPGGIVVHDEMELIQQHPEYLNLTTDGAPPAPTTSNLGLANGSSSGMQSVANSRPDTDVEEDNNSRTPVDALSEDDKSARDGLDDDLDDMLNDKSDDDGDDDDKPSLEADPAYQALLQARVGHTKKVLELRKDISKMVANIESMANPVMKSRLQQQKDGLDVEMAQAQAALDAAAAAIRAMEDAHGK
ncbi:Aste57867_14564 [Aphanomyces stellatus]|uniref:Aste57867_14564 protein n=1 Tax=Aphanomyces stellatus TaxID=120398 RepID=A0A485L114_9STRA|nr:hypothetical protein As57867_014510 [Aphanomyces stellatus]VFT91384.1 Aste57867_14564 [Aphanomyces stellatus]